MYGSAGYRFVPINGKIVAPPLSYAEIDLSEPNKDGSVSGVLEALWSAETPVCVGEKGENNKIHPIKFGERYCLPGASLRGMVRAVTEIATFSHLGRINSARHCSVRTYENKAMPHYHRHYSQDLKAGWLTYDKAAKTWTLRRASNLKEDVAHSRGYRLLHVGEILYRIRSAATMNEWRAMTLEEKRRLLHQGKGVGLQTAFDGGAYREGQRNGLKKAVFNLVAKLSASAKEKLAVRGYIVCSGETETPADDPSRAKVWEAFLGVPDRDAGLDLPLRFMELFHRLHADPSYGRGEPLGAWRYWLGQLTCCDGTSYLEAWGGTPKEKDAPPIGDNLPGIPVFYKGDPRSLAGAEHPARQPFFMGLSRVLRTPWARSVGEVAQRIYEESESEPKAYRVPRLADGEGWDFARAMFGDVDVNPASPDGAPGPDASALAGRIAFECAFAQGDPEPTEPVTGVLAGPRESFVPFYLRRARRTDGDAGATYDEAAAIPAGRKRYVVRKEPADSLPQGNDNEGTKTTIRFLPKGTRFRGRIRFHNLHPVELGALLWALSFGEPGGRFRHQIGRAKAHGYGVLNAEIRFVRPPKVCNSSEFEKKRDDMTAYLEAFRAYMQKRLGAPLEGATEIQTLQRLADPKAGQAAADKGLLATGSLEDYSRWKDSNQRLSQI